MQKYAGLTSIATAERLTIVSFYYIKKNLTLNHYMKFYLDKQINLEPTEIE